MGNKELKITLIYKTGPHLPRMVHPHNLLHHFSSDSFCVAESGELLDEEAGLPGVGQEKSTFGAYNEHGG